MWFWPTADRGSLSGFSGAELPIVIAIGLLVVAGAIVYWINETQESPGMHVFRFFWKLFALVGLPAIAILNWNYNFNFDFSSLLFSSLLTSAAVTGAVRALLGKRFAKAKPISSSIATDLNVLLMILTMLAGLVMILELPLAEALYALLSGLAAIGAFMMLVGVRKESAGKKEMKLSEFSGFVSFALIFFALVIGLLIQFIVRGLALANVWQAVTFWAVLVIEAIFSTLMLLSLAGKPEDASKR